QFVELPQNADDLPQVQLLSRCFLGGMLATRADDVRNSDNAGARQGETKPEVPIHCPEQMRPEITSGSFPNLAGEQHLRLEEPVSLLPGFAPVQGGVKRERHGIQRWQSGEMLVA